MDENEDKYAQFVKEKIEKAGGTLKFQHITGHLSQLQPNIRNYVGGTSSELMKFLRKHTETFIIDSNGNVSLQKGNQESQFDGSKTVFPENLRNKEGIVIKIQPLFGFITIKDPKANVYFTPSVYVSNEGRASSNQSTLLTDFHELVPGKKVLLNASLGRAEYKTSYRANKVWLPKDVKNEVLVPEGFKPRVPKIDMYEPNSFEGSGTVEKVFPKYGFIIFDDDSSKHVFFHKDRVCNVQNLKDLTKIFNESDSVEFMAVRSSKKDQKVVWQATKVWKKKPGHSYLKAEDSSGIGTLEKERNGKSFPREMLQNVPGKIYPHNNGTVIKFGKNDCDLADADSCIFYVHLTKVEDICWEFCDGDNVFFDGVEIKSTPGFMALLAWVGEKPKVVLSPTLGDFGDLSDEEGDYISKSSVTPIKTLECWRRPPPSVFGKHNYGKPAICFSSQRKDISNGSQFSELASEDTQSSLSLDSASQVSSQKGNRRQRHRSKPFKAPFSSTNKARTREQYGNEPLNSKDNYNNLKASKSNNSRPEKTFNNLRKFSSKESINSGYSDRSEPNPALLPIAPVCKNWGDSPYPDGDDVEEMSQTSYTPDNDITLDFTDSDEEPAKSKNHSEIADSIETCSEDEESNTLSSQAKVYSISKEISDNEGNCTNKPELVRSSNQIVKDKPVKSVLKESILSDESSEESTRSEKAKPYIKRHRNLEGKLIKVYCKYAEIDNSALKKSASFFSNVLYLNGVPASEKFDHLKEVLSVGQTVKFNSIEIVDDDGGLWQKVTMVWKGVKPNIQEMTPSEYISQNKLHVSVEEEEDVESMGLLNTVKESTVPPPRKFLTVAFSSLDDESQATPPETVESSILSNEIPHLKSNILSQKPVIPLEKEMVADDNMVELTGAVSRMIYSCLELHADVETVSENIVKLIMVTSGKTFQVSQLSNKYFPSVEDFSLAEVAKEIKPSCSGGHQIEMISSQTQTIVTGDVISQSQFPGKLTYRG